MNQLFFGDNLDVLRESIKDESVDLVYLDPPFNSKRDYNLLFKSPEGGESHAQITAFEDTWHWGEQAEREYDQILHSGHTQVADLISAFRSFLGENDLMAYLVMMANRLIELHRVLKPGGSLYLHCDPTASHYLKILLDALFEQNGFRNEIIWCYAGGGIPKKDFPRKHDVLLRCAKGGDPSVFNPVFRSYSEGTQKRGRTQVKGKYFEEGLREEGTPINDWWTDITPIKSPTDKEKLGYPTQKPLTLLERVINVSSNPGDVILDPFCGCGTAVHAAQKLGRQWIGIDITHLAVSLIEKRLKDAFPGIAFEVHGTPKDLEGAQELAARDKYQFQWWACSLVDAQPFQGRKKGADGGIDGLIYFADAENGKPVTRRVVVSVKGGHVTVNQVRDLKGVLEREKAPIGLFVTLEPPTAPMKKEAAAAGFFTGANGKPYPKLQLLTIEDLLNGHARPQFPDLALGTLTFKRAKKENLSLAAETPNLFTNED